MLLSYNDSMQLPISLVGTKLCLGFDFVRRKHYPQFKPQPHFTPLPRFFRHSTSRVRVRARSIFPLPSSARIPPSFTFSSNEEKARPPACSYRSWRWSWKSLHGLPCTFLTVNGWSEGEVDRNSGGLGMGGCAYKALSRISLASRSVFCAVVD
jgi:hypothetical protein